MTNLRFTSDRVRLRAPEPADVEAWQAFLNDERLFGRRYVPWGTRDVAPYSRAQVEAILEAWGQEKKALHLAIEAPGHELVGHAGCHWGWDPHCPSAWVVVAPDHQRQGIGSAVLDLLLTRLFEDTPAHNVNGWIASWNASGLAFADEHGFARSGCVPWSGLRAGQPFDEIMIDILKPEWLARRGASHGA